jgi:hypothetical protein
VREVCGIMSRPFVLLFCLALVAGSASARTWTVLPDSTGDAPTIQAGIDSAAAGDTVLVACGTYYEHDIQLKSGIALCSETGEADCAVIDAQWMGRALFFYMIDNTTTIRGFTLTHGAPPQPYIPPGYGGAVASLGSSEQFVDCVFTDNVASEGAGAFCQDGSPAFTGCLFSNNDGIDGGALLLDGVVATVSGCTFTGNSSILGGTIYCSHGSPRIMHCTFYDNPAEAGAQIYCFLEGSPAIENTIIAYSSLGEAVRCEDETNSPTLTCCDLYGNAEGDWTGCISEQLGVNGNFSACPSFCHANMGDLRLCDQSPCLPGNHPDGYDCGLIGAWPEGCNCGASKTEVATWGRVKAMFR